MKHLEDLQNEMLTNGEDSPRFIDTRMDGMVPESIHHPEFHVREKPQSPAFRKPVMGSARNFLLMAFVFFLASIGYFSFVFGRGAGSVSEENIAIEIIGSSFVTSGASSEYEMVIENKNTSPIQSVVAVMEVPQPGGRAPESIRTTIGEIPARSQKRTKFPVTLFGAQFDERELKGVVEFTFPGSRANLKRSIGYPVRIAESPVRLEVTAPDRLVVGQQTAIEIAIVTQSLLTNVGLRVEYPDGFEVESTSLSPAAGSYFWEFGRLPANKQTTLVIKGSFRGIPILGTANSFRASVGSLSRDDRILSNIYATRSREVVVGTAGLTAVLFAGGSSDDRVALFPGSDLSGYVLVTNTTSTPIRNASVALDFSGGNFDYSRVRIGTGYFDSANSRVSWSPQSGSVDLALVSPGQTIQLEYAIGTKSTWIQSQQVGRVDVSVQGQTESGELISAQNIDSLEISESARLGLVQKTLYVDGSFENSGPNPPKIGESTTYTIHWTLPRQIVDFSEVVVLGVLPVYVEWLDQVDPSNASVQYDPVTRIVRWSQGDVLARSASDPSVSFQVRMTPSIIHKQTTPTLVGSVELSGVNSLTRETFKYIKQEHTTRLRGDSVATSGSVE
jgi:hypothetical protein